LAGAGRYSNSRVLWVTIAGRLSRTFDPVRMQPIGMSDLHVSLPKN